MIKLDGHIINELKLTASDGTTVTKALTEEGTIPTPTATKDITANGSNIDVANYAKVNVNVPTSSGSGLPEGLAGYHREVVSIETAITASTPGTINHNAGFMPDIVALRMIANNNPTYDEYAKELITNRRNKFAFSVDSRDLSSSVAFTDITITDMDITVQPVNKLGRLPNNTTWEVICIKFANELV